MESMNLIYYLTLKLFFQYVIGYIPETQWSLQTTNLCRVYSAADSAIHANYWGSG